MQRLLVHAVALCLIAVTPITLTAGASDDLLSAPASKLDLGQLKLSIAAERWARSYREQPGLRVLMFRNKLNGIDFSLDPSGPLRAAKTRVQAETICAQIARHFMSMVLGNAGDPTAKDINENNIYLMAWGSYFASSSDTAEIVQEIGKVISAGSTVSIYVGRQDLERCEFPTGSKYKRVPYA